MRQADYIAFVPLRAGSKGLPGKNVLPFAGLPLYEHAVHQGLRCCNRCIISTDIKEILARGSMDGCVLSSRSADLAADMTSMDEVLKEAISRESLGGRIIVLLQATSPLRRDEDIRSAMDLHRSGVFDLVMSVTAHDRSVLKCGMVENGYFQPTSKPEYCFSNRQSLPDIYRPNGAVYVFSADWLIENDGLATDRIGAVIMPDERSYDIDTQQDFTQAERQYVAAPMGRGAQ